MRFFAVCTCVFAVGCAAASEPVALPPDLGTRRAGVDWPRFLGPTGDGVSPETGLVVPWPKEGPRLVWQKRLSEGYAAATISRGRLFVFDRVAHARLNCLKSETGDPLWTFEYPTDYEDLTTTAAARVASRRGRRPRISLRPRRDVALSSRRRR